MACWTKILLLTLAGSWMAGAAVGTLAAEKIASFDAEIQMHQDASIRVTERIEYDFGAEQRHGIFRTIPNKYKARGGNYSLEVSDITVSDAQGKRRPFSTTTPGRNIEIKIGDPELAVTGQQVYVIGYTVQRAINYFDSHDELYWNVTGTEWEAPIEQVSAAVLLPQALERDQVRFECFAGIGGSATPCSQIQPIPGTGTEAGGIAAETESLPPGSGVTVVVGLPKGILYEPTMLEKTMNVVADNWIVAVPMIVFSILFYLWWTRGRDPKGRGAIVTQFDPPDDLTPSQIGVIIDEKAHNKDLTADIIHLAVRGYLRINRIEKPGIFMKRKADYSLDKLKAGDDLANKFEHTLLNRLFDGKNQVVISSLKNEFYKDLEKVRKGVYSSVVEKGYFVRNPRRVRRLYQIIGVVVAILAVPAAALLGVIAAISLFVAGMLVIGFSFVMPVKTKKGVLTQEYILGLKRYLSIAEKARIRFHNAPEKNPERFDKLLPYAMVLGVEKEWAAQFSGIHRTPPSWYNDPSGRAFVASAFVSDMNQFSSSTNSTLSSRPSSASSGGSGFSGGGVGGGFGGGGGGSW